MSPTKGNEASKHLDYYARSLGGNSGDIFKFRSSNNQLDCVGEGSEVLHSYLAKLYVRKKETKRTL